jgi:hypothetical protein
MRAVPFETDKNSNNPHLSSVRASQHNALETRLGGFTRATPFETDENGNNPRSSSARASHSKSHDDDNYNVDDFARDEDWFAEEVDEYLNGKHDGDITITANNQRMDVDVAPTHTTSDPRQTNIVQPSLFPLATQGQGIPLHPDGFIDYYHNTPKKSKRGRERAESIESRQSKVHRRSASHSTAPTVPSTKFSTRTHSPSYDQSESPVGETDLRGASRVTGGVIRGRAHGNNFNLADRGMIFFFIIVF